MSLKLKAFIQLVALTAAGVAGAELINLVLTHVSKETLVTAFQLGLIGGMFYLGYALILARLEYYESVKNLKETFDKK